MSESMPTDTSSLEPAFVSLLNEQDHSNEVGFDYSAVALVAGFGLVTGYVLKKLCLRKLDDEFTRV